MVSCFARAYHTGANACPVFSDTTARTLRFCLFGFLPYHTIFYAQAVKNFWHLCRHFHEKKPSIRPKKISKSRKKHKNALYFFFPALYNAVI